MPFDSEDEPPNSKDDQEYENFSTYKNGERVKFQFSMIFNNKDLIRDVIKENAMERKKNI